MVTVTHGPGVSAVVLVSQLISVTAAAANEVQRVQDGMCDGSFEKH